MMMSRKSNPICGKKTREPYWPETLGERGGAIKAMAGYYINMFYKVKPTTGGRY
jgi:hypothetical protein